MDKKSWKDIVMDAVDHVSNDPFTRKDLQDAIREYELMEPERLESISLKSGLSTALNSHGDDLPIKRCNEEERHPKGLIQYTRVEDESDKSDEQTGDIRVEAPGVEALEKGAKMEWMGDEAETADLPGNGEPANLLSNMPENVEHIQSTMSSLQTQHTELKNQVTRYRRNLTKGLSSLRNLMYFTIGLMVVTVFALTVASMYLPV